MGSLRRLLGLAVVLAAACGAVVALHRLGDLPWLAVGWDDVPGWLETVSAEDAVMAALRLVALVAAYWLLATTTAYTVARAARLPSAVAAVEWATLPAVRRLADRAIAVALTGSAAFVGPASTVMAAGDGGGEAGGMVLPPAVTAPAVLPAERPSPAWSAPPERAVPPAPDAPAPAQAGAPAQAAAPARAPASGDAPDTAETRVVAPGDNLWVIAAAQLPRDATLAQIHAHWQALVAVNRDALRSGDPDLIHPGERLVLPP